MFYDFDNNALRAIGRHFSGGGADDPGNLAGLNLKSVTADLFGADAAASPWQLFWLAKLDRLFLLNPPDAPGLCFAGGVLHIADAGGNPQPFSVTGLGLTAERALGAAAGEIAEYCALYGSADLTADGSGAPLPRVESLLQRLPHAAGAPELLNWVPATRLSDAQTVLVPQALCHGTMGPGSKDEPSIPLSEGCGAGRTLDEATEHGICELIERDAFALWWYGGRPARALAMDRACRAAFADYRAAVRGHADTRKDALLDISTEFGVSVVAAVSWNRENHRLACGTAARGTYGAAIRAAYRELCQLEFGYHLTERKRRELGDAGLSATDRARLDQGRRLDASRIPMLKAAGTPTTVSVADWDAALAVSGIATRTDALPEIELYWTEIGQPDADLKTVKVLSPDLQPGNPNHVSARLTAALSRTGGTDELTQGKMLV